MNSLENQIIVLERLYKFNKLKLLYIKLFTILAGVLAIMYAFDYSQSLIGVDHLTKTDIIIANFIVAILVLTPIILTPLYKLFSDRVTNKVNWNIKTSIFTEVLNKYQSDYKISFQGILPDSDLSFLKLNNGITRFAYGDDLIFGTINSMEFRLCEVHSINLIGKGFHGIVGVILLNEDHTKLDLYSISQVSDDSMIVRTNKEKYYILKKAKNSLFEFSIKDHFVNSNQLVKDYTFFDQFVGELNSISNKLAEKKASC